MLLYIRTVPLSKGFVMDFIESNVLALMGGCVIFLGLLIILASILTLRSDDGVLDQIAAHENANAYATRSQLAGRKPFLQSAVAMGILSIIGGLVLLL
jgi:hypothetical protein